MCVRTFASMKHHTDIQEISCDHVYACACACMYVVWFTNIHVYIRSCFCDASQGYTSSSTLQTFCATFYTTTATQTNTFVTNTFATVLSSRNSVNMSGADFANLANQDTYVSLPSTYSVKVQGSLDVRAEGFYRLCVTSSEPATVCMTISDCVYMLAYMHACTRVGNK